MVKIQLDLTKTESEKLDELKFDFRVGSKVDVIKKLIIDYKGG